MPPTITADFVLGKTGNRIAVALAREAVAAARLYGVGVDRIAIALREMLAGHCSVGFVANDGQRRGKVVGKQHRQARRPAKSAAFVMCHVTRDNLQTPAREGAEEP